MRAKVKLNQRMSFLVEYYPRIKDNPEKLYKDAFAFGIDLIPSGQVFQFQFTNSMYTSGFTQKKHWRILQRQYPLWLQYFKNIWKKCSQKEK